VVLELIGKVALGGEIFGEKEDAGGVFVEAMENAEAGIGCAGAGEFGLAGEELEEAVGFAAAGDSGEMSGFGDGDEVLIFKENGKRG
jgi:hypothetical protein